MSSLVADFIINPVLRQARRISEGAAAAGAVWDPLTRRRAGSPIQDGGEGQGKAEGSPQEELGHGEVAPVTTAGESRGAPISQDADDEIITAGAGRPLATSPPSTEGGEGQDESTTTQRPTDSESTSAVDPMAAVPMGPLSNRSDTTATDDDASDNHESGLQNSPTSFISRTETPMSEQTPGGSPIPNRNSNRESSSALPEDDGMRSLRRRIIAIQSMDIVNGEKARMMHELLTEGYTQSQISQQTKPALPQTHSPASMVSQERPVTPTSSFNFWHSSPGRGDNVTFQLSPGDLQATYAPPSTQGDGVGEREEETEENQVLGCEHYKRNVKLQCSECKKWYTCRLCHDAAEDHVLPRKETKNMLCMLCGSAQKAADQCAQCGARAANYYCDICHLWEDDPNRSIYHCNDCGICRVGRGLGKDFFHCKTCGLCMNISMEKSHKCIERSTDCDCPICGDYMFTSPQTVVFMRCGHTIHRHCYHAHLETSYKCPICQQTVVNMETQFRNLDRAIEVQPMPEQFRDTRAMVSCNDCRAKSAVKYHWLGLRCAVCDSYNTRQLAIITDGVLQETPVDANENSGVEMTGSEMAIPAGRQRRHSSQAGEYLAPTDVTDGFAPYIPSRLGRSASPVRGNYFTEHATAARVPPDTAADPGVWDDEHLDFWGRSPADLADEEEDDEEEEYSDSELAMDDIDDDEGDEIDRMELFGHR